MAQAAVALLGFVAHLLIARSTRSERRANANELWRGRRSGAYDDLEASRIRQ